MSFLTDQGANTKVQQSRNTILTGSLYNKQNYEGRSVV